MLIKEYRMTLPLTVEEYQIAQLYMVAKKSKETTKDGEGIEIIKNEPFDNDKGKGQYTEKIIYLANSIPRFAAAILPASALQVEEKAWNAYPYCKTVYSCPFFGEKLVLSIESMHLPGRGEVENALKCDNETLLKREVDFIDIAFDAVEQKDYVKEEDPQIFKSTKTNRGPLNDKDWRKKVEPVMTCYKLVHVEFKYWGFQTKVESVIQKTGVRDVLLKAHRALFCWIDEWIGLSMKDIRDIEDQTKLDLQKKLEEQNQLNKSNK